jgi:hypothetical protein
MQASGLRTAVHAGIANLLFLLQSAQSLDVPKDFLMVHAEAQKKGSARSTLRVRAHGS